MDEPRFTVDKRSVMPLYYQLKEYVKNQIDTKQYKVNELIPSERELSEHFEINRMTVRQAINELVQEGLLQRQRGVGTFVAKVKINQPLTKLTNFSSDMLNKGIMPGARHLSMEVIFATKAIASYLQISEGEEVIELVRVRTGDGEPMALERSYLVHELARPIVGLNMENVSLYQTLEKQCGLHLIRALETIEISYVNPADAHYLDIEQDEAVLLIERITFSKQYERPVEFVRSIYRGDRYKFSIEMNI